MIRRIPPAPALVLAAMAALSWAVVVYETGGAAFDLSGVRISSRSPRMPLAVAGAAFVLAWAYLVHRHRDGRGVPHRDHRRRDTPAAPPGRRLPVRFLLLPLAAAVTFNVLFMSGPTPPPGEHHCVFDIDLGSRFHHYLNCDAPEFLALARRPALVLGPNEIRQSRPLSFGIPYVLAAPFRALGALETSGPYEPYAPEYFGFVAINLATLFAAIILFTRIVEHAGGAPGVELVFGVMAVTTNELTRPFLFNPHTQIFNVLVPLLSLALAMRLIARGTALTWRAAIGIGLALGIGMLWYGSFAVAALCAAVVQLVFFRSPITAVVLGLSALLPYAAWAGWLIRTIGHFYNHEVAQFRQFVWIADCARAGAAGCTSVLATKAAELWSVSWPVLVAPLVCIALLHVALRLRGVSPGNDTRRRPYRQGMAIALGVTAIFVALIGYYVWRLSWMLVPLLAVVITLQMQALRRAWPVLDGWRGVAAVIALLAVWIGVLFARQGPYS